MIAVSKRLRIAQIASAIFFCKFVQEQAVFNDV